jgi:hypothetical protein
MVGGIRLTFEELFEQVVAMLRWHKRVTYQALSGNGGSDHQSWPWA